MSKRTKIMNIPTCVDACKDFLPGSSATIEQTTTTLMKSRDALSLEDKEIKANSGVRFPRQIPFCEVFLVETFNCAKIMKKITPLALTYSRETSQVWKASSWPTNPLRLRLTLAWKVKLEFKPHPLAKIPSISLLCQVPRGQEFNLRTGWLTLSQ